MTACLLTFWSGSTASSSSSSPNNPAVLAQDQSDMIKIRWLQQIADLAKNSDKTWKNGYFI